MLGHLFEYCPLYEVIGNLIPLITLQDPPYDEVFILKNQHPITFPGQLNSDIQVPESNKKIFHDLLTDLKKGLKKNAEKQHLVLPLECHYLNKNAFLSVVGSQPQNVKHFTLRRKPKAAALKAEMMNKSQVSPS